MRRMPEEKNLCMDCQYAKDKWHGSCFCTYFGMIIYRGKKNCWGHEMEEVKDEQTDDHWEPDEGA